MSSATPTMMRMDVPPNAWIRWLPVKEKMIEGTTAMSAMKSSARKRHVVERVLDVGRGSRYPDGRPE